MPKRLNSYEKECFKELAEAANNAANQRLGNGGTYITGSTLAWAGRTLLKTPNLSAQNAIGKLTEQEVSRLYVIKREVGRGYAITMHDLQFLIEVIERCGL